MKDLCGMQVRKDDEGYYVLQMVDRALRDPSAGMQARWSNLSYLTKVWDDPEAASKFGQGVLHPNLAKDLYTLPSEILMAQAEKQIVLVNHIVRDPEQLATVRQQADEPQANNANLRSGLDELTNRVEQVDKELNELRAGLAESQMKE
ncbi:hypothetical protein BHE74_00049795 [Ensete ventricosum]|nr:hypothetical protein BHE74_00049795 [Ensete ventricosum]